MALKRMKTIPWIMFMLLSLAFLLPPEVRSASNAYIFMSQDPCHWDCDVYFSAPYTAFDVWIWVLPGDQGFKGVEFGFMGGANTIYSSVTSNPYATTIDDDLEAVKVSFNKCLEGWTWLYKLECFSTTTDPYLIEIGPNSDTGLLRAFDCSDSTQEYSMALLANFGVNTGCG